MNSLTYIDVKEATKILKKPENRRAKKKVSVSIGGASGFLLIKPDNREYNRAPVVPCHCYKKAMRFGVALRLSKKEILFICVKCGDITVKSSKQYPFMFIKEGNGERPTIVKKKKRTAEGLG